MSHYPLHSYCLHHTLSSRLEKLTESMCGLELVSPSTFRQLLAYALKDKGLLKYKLKRRSTQQTRLIDIMITTPACRIPPIPKQRRHICYYFSGPFTKFNIFPDRFVGFWRDKSSILFGLSSINY